MDNVESGKQKAHQPRHAGRKVAKKLQKQKSSITEIDPKKRNSKAFTFNSVIKAERKFRRTQDLLTKKHHLPVIDRSSLEPPPYIVAIVGPPKVGKSTLLRCLIKNYCRQNLANIQGPITVISGKKKRITFLECNNNINCMIDIAKISDIILLLIDASFGFEMETFEFLNICQIHGFPRILGVLTHLDLLKHNKQQQKIKKKLKHRFWTEIYQGAKLFYLSGLLHGNYLRTEIKNLARFISIMKCKPLSWRSMHSYLLGDRMEDITSQEKIRSNPKIDRTICIYGYVRGLPLKEDLKVHIPGCCDFKIASIMKLDDPCPLPNKEKKRSLNEKEKLIYAPMSGVGGIVYDKDAVYIELGRSHLFDVQENIDASKKPKLLNALLDNTQTVDYKLNSSSLQLFSESKCLTDSSIKKINALKFSTEIDYYEDSKVIMDNCEENNNHEREKVFQTTVIPDINPETKTEISSSISSTAALNQVSEICPINFETNSNNPFSVEALKYKPELLDIKRKISETLSQMKNSKNYLDWNKTNNEHDNSFYSDASDMHNNGTNNYTNDQNENTNDECNILLMNAANSLYKIQSSNKKLHDLVYNNNDILCNENKDGVKQEVGSLFYMKKSKNAEEKIYADKYTIDSSKFNDVLQDWKEIEIQNQIRDCFVTGKWEHNKDASTLLTLGQDENEKLYGNFEDFELRSKSESENLEEEKFDMDYDNQPEKENYFDELKKEAENLAKLNCSEFHGIDENLRIQYEGYRSGMYVRIEINNIPCELIDYFDPTYPLIIGGLSTGEANSGYLQARFKKHRWHKQILKTNNPLIVSVGWRRFQTIPLFSIQDHNGRNRLIKYTPEHMHCIAHLWGPITTQGTGILALQALTEQCNNFRIAATGTILALDKSVQIVKKLKLIGTPFKIFKKTAFVQGMFNSALEVAKFEGAKITTVSGIRGHIKKALSSPVGSFRATFEDKIVLSDIVFLRTWYPVSVPKFCYPVANLLHSQTKRNIWEGMKTIGQLKKEQSIHVLPNLDNLYIPVIRKLKARMPLTIPKNLEKQLPYEDRPKKRILKSPSYLTKKIKITVVPEPKEQEILSMMKMLKALYKHKTFHDHTEAHKRVKSYKKQIKYENSKKSLHEKKLRKKVFKALGKIEAKKKN